MSTILTIRRYVPREKNSERGPKSKIIKKNNVKAGFLNCTRDSPAGGAIGAALLVLVLVVGRMLYDVMLRLSVPISGYGTGARAEIRPPPPGKSLSLLLLC